MTWKIRTKKEMCPHSHRFTPEANLMCLYPKDTSTRINGDEIHICEIQFCKIKDGDAIIISSGRCPYGDCMGCNSYGQKKKCKHPRRRGIFRLCEKEKCPIRLSHKDPTRKGESCGTGRVTTTE